MYVLTEREELYNLERINAVLPMPCRDKMYVRLMIDETESAIAAKYETKEQAKAVILDLYANMKDHTTEVYQMPTIKEAEKMAMATNLYEVRK